MSNPLSKYREMRIGSPDVYSSADWAGVCDELVKELEFYKDSLDDKEWAAEAGGAVHKTLSEEHQLLQDIVHNDVIPLLLYLGEGSTLGLANNILARLHTYIKLPLCTKCTHPIKGTKDLCYECLTGLKPITEEK